MFKPQYFTEQQTLEMMKIMDYVFYKNLVNAIGTHLFDKANTITREYLELIDEWKKNIHELDSYCPDPNS